jgi:predicted TIM-barrel fold metal-dependent hydrolase
MLKVIDADAHVVETERTWEFMLPEDQRYRPAVLQPKPGYRTPAPEYWLIDGRAFGKNANVGQDTPDAAREGEDIRLRLRHMDELGVAIHVLYPTIFLRPLTIHAEVETALCRGYNRWVAHIAAQGEGRLRWVVLVPLMSLDRAIEEMHFGKEHGACGVFMRAIEGEQRLSDPYFFPLYEEASRLNLPICIHSGIGNFDMFDLFNRDSGFATFKMPAVAGFHDLILKGVPSRFPDLRWGFVEISSQWLPYALNDLAIRFRRQGKPFPGKSVLQENRIYVACQTTDDLKYVIDTVGDENLVIGTDYGHNDTSSEIEALRRLQESSQLDRGTAEKILSHNPARLYGI